MLPNAAVSAAGSVASAGTARLPGTSAATASSFSRLRPTSATRYPPAAKRRAKARPLPGPAPTTTQILSGMVGVLPQAVSSAAVIA